MVEIEKSFFPLKNLAGLMMGTKTFKIWPFWPELLRFKVALKFATLVEILVKCEPGGEIKRGLENNNLWLVTLSLIQHQSAFDLSLASTDVQVTDSCRHSVQGQDAQG